MNIILYKSSAESIRLDKSNYITKSIELQGSLRQSTSIINPSIIIELNNANVTKVVDSMNLGVVDSSNELIAYVETIMFNENYAYIPQFERYYFIDDMVSIRNNVWEIKMRVDVLMSFKDKILQQDAYILRNEFDYNDEIVDSELPLETIPKTEIVTLTNDLMDDNEDADADYYVLTAVANENEEYSL